MPVPEPDNPFDPNAVSVRSNGERIGYLPRAIAAQWVAPLNRVIHSNLVPVTPAQIYLSERTDWSSVTRRNPEPATVGYADVRVRLRDPALAVPLNNPPNQGHTMLPRSAIVQVVKEADYFSALAPLVPHSGKGHLYATLHRDEAITVRSSKPVVAVHINGNKIGELTPAMSARFLPLIDHLDSRGLVPTCWSDITGSGVAAEVRIDAVKANEASNSVLNGPPNTIPPLVPAFISTWWTHLMTPRNRR